MKRLSFSLKLFITLFVLCIAGIVFSTIAIDSQIDSYIEEMKTEIKIVNNTDDNIVVMREGNEIVININPEEDIEEATEPEEDFVIFEGKVISESGLNIRQEPSVESEKVDVLEYGEDIIIIEEEGDWYRTEQGYIFKDYIIKN